ncbi:unnamed protein product [Peronospora destructor]|uniref:Uncharacterized protein n=1 Tax=Peronospora destructor TaxID=86335 RepID=A0AAV0V158_9STRA|nr:unnamed protein product [Peronospora destructor]
MTVGLEQLVSAGVGPHHFAPRTRGLAANFEEVKGSICLVDGWVVNPEATRLAESVATRLPSFLLQDRLKSLTPQRAQYDAVTDPLVFLVLRGPATQESASSSCKWTLCAMFAPAAPRCGAEYTKAKAATQQVCQTLQFVVDFFASDNDGAFLEPFYWQRNLQPPIYGGARSI